MRGTILVYNDNKGIISGHDGNRYHFAKIDWTGKKNPVEGQEIDFAVEGENAKNIFLLPSQSFSQRSKGTLALVCLFLGGFGIHRFMVGKTGSGIAMLLLTCSIIGVLVTGAWALIDFIMILSGSFTDKDGNRIT